jgi:hypothetical protein
MNSGQRILGETKYVINTKEKKEQNIFTSSVISSSVGREINQKNDVIIDLDINKKKKIPQISNSNLKNSKITKNLEKNLLKNDGNIKNKQDFHILNPKRANSCFFCLKAEPQFLIPACTSWLPLPPEVYIYICICILYVCIEIYIYMCIRMTYVVMDLYAYMNISICYFTLIYRDEQHREIK